MLLQFNIFHFPNRILFFILKFVVQLLSCVLLLATPQTVPCQASLSFTISQSLCKLMSTESLMPSNHIILCRPLLLLPSIFPSTRVLFSELTLRIRWPKYWSFSFSISPFKEYSGLISFRIYWFDLSCYFWKPLLNTITFVSQFKHVCKFKLRPSSSCDQALSAHLPPHLG